MYCGYIYNVNILYRATTDTADATVGRYSEAGGEQRRSGSDHMVEETRRFGVAEGRQADKRVLLQGKKIYSDG